MEMNINNQSANSGNVAMKCQWRQRRRWRPGGENQHTRGIKMAKAGGIIWLKISIGNVAANEAMA
jgi:hypothetical protein